MTKIAKEKCLGVCDSFLVKKNILHKKIAKCKLQTNEKLV